VQRILLNGRARLDAQIMKAANDPKLATSVKRRRALYKGIADTYAEIGTEAATWASKSVTGAAKAAFANGKADNTLGMTWGQFSRKHLEDYIAVVNPTNAPELVGVSQMASSDIKWLRKQYVDAFQTAAVTGESTRAIQKQLKNAMLSKRPAWKLTDSAGRKWDPDNYFNMLTRTTIATVNRDAYVAAGTEAGADLYEVAGGPPTAPPPDPCWEWYGKIISMTGETPGYPTAADAEADGLFHPNCVHYYAVVLPSELDDAKRDEAATDARRDESKELAVERDKELRERKD